MESEILGLIDQLEELLSVGGRLPLSSRVMIAAPDAFRLLDQMRQSLPREIVRARHIYQERERIVSDAQAEADATRDSARAEREALIAGHSVTVEALRAAEELKRETRAQCDRMRLEADAYALHSLRDLQVQVAHIRAALDTTQKTVAGGIEHLESRTRHAAQVEPRVTASKE